LSGRKTEAVQRRVQGEGGVGSHSGRGSDRRAGKQIRVHRTLINAWKWQAIEGIAGVLSSKMEAAAANRAVSWRSSREDRPARRGRDF
jgi:hypothetical protein